MGSQHLKPLAKIQNGINIDDAVYISFERTGKALFALNRMVLVSQGAADFKGQLDIYKFTTEQLGDDWSLMDLP
jgi:hypothetical protein